MTCFLSGKQILMYDSKPIVHFYRTGRILDPPSISFVVRLTS